MFIRLPFHNGEVSIEIAGDPVVEIVGQKSPPVLQDLSAHLERSLEHPVSSKPLSSLLPEGGYVTILVPDATRGGGTRLLLPMLVEYLAKLGFDEARVKVVVAGGAHEKMGEQEIRDHLGASISNMYEVMQHRAGEDEDTVRLGTTSSRTPVLVNSVVAGSQLVVCAGPMSFHYFAGFGGGRKMIMPGVAGLESIVANHRLSLRHDPAMGLSKGCRPGNLSRNPVHSDMVEAAGLLSNNTFMINYVTNPDGAISYINAGEMVASHSKACGILEEDFGIRLDKKYSTVIASAGGAPKDINLLQAHKTIRHASRALEEGGKLYCLAACPEGVGSKSYDDAFRDGSGGVPRRVRTQYTLNSQTAVSTVGLTGSHSIYLMSKLEEETTRRFGFIPWKEGEAAVPHASEREVLVINNASYFLPRLI